MSQVTERDAWTCPHMIGVHGIERRSQNGGKLTTLLPLWLLNCELKTLVDPKAALFVLVVALTA